MSDIPREALYEAAFSIVRTPEEQGFERRPSVAFDLGRDPVAITCALITGDPEDPPLTQANFLREDVGRLETIAVAFAADELAGKHLPNFPDHDMEELCRQLREAAEEVEPIPEEHGFEMIALHAIYSFQNRYMPQTFVSRGFVDVLSEKVQISLEATEEELRQAYAVMAEHNPNIEPFDEWVTDVEAARAAAGTEEQAQRLFTETSLSWLVVPRHKMHPVVSAWLFEQ